MAKGGARARSGPAPDPQSLRSADGDWTTLPIEGRTGDAPAWPMPTQTDREAEVWADLWTMPQAIVWERNRQHRIVALYVRRLVEAEASGSAVNLSTLVRQLADELMLTTSGMLRARVKIDAPKEGGAGRGGASSNRARLTVVDGGS